MMMDVLLLKVVVTVVLPVVPLLIPSNKPSVYYYVHNYNYAAAGIDCYYS